MIHFLFKVIAYWDSAAPAAHRGACLTEAAYPGRLKGLEVSPALGVRRLYGEPIAAQDVRILVLASPYNGVVPIETKR